MRESARMGRGGPTSYLAVGRVPRPARPPPPASASAAPARPPPPYHLNGGGVGVRKWHPSEIPDGRLSALEQAQDVLTRMAIRRTVAVTRHA
jgi:hypothetical protein